MRRFLVVLLAVVPLLGACGESAKSGSSPAPTTVGSVAVPSGASEGSPLPASVAPSGSAPGSSAAPSGALGGSLPPGAPAASLGRSGALILRAGAGTVGDALLSVDAVTGRLVARLPVGVPDSTWTTLYATSPATGATTLRAVDTRTGDVLRQVEVAGEWRLPSGVPGALPGGLAEPAGRLVLVDPTAGPTTSRFAIIDAAFAERPRIVTLDGQFEFDAIGPNAGLLFLIEQLTDVAGHYQVRAYDLNAGSLVPGAVVDKLEIDEVMQGRPVARAASGDGVWLDTIYVRGDGTAFVHQLDTLNAYTLCLDLPDEVRGMTPADGDAWQIALTGADGGFVANGRLQFMARINTGGIGATTHGDLKALRGLATGPTGSAYLLEPTVLRVLDASLQTAGYGPPVEGRGLAVAPDRSALYVLTNVGRVERMRFGSGGVPAADGSITLDPAVDWTAAEIVGVATD